MSQDTVSATAEKICRALLGDARKVDCDIIESHIRELLAASAGDTHDAELEEAQREVDSMRYQRDAWRADAERLDKLQDESWDLRSFCIGEEDVGWRIVEFHQAAPHERVVAEVFRDDPRAAIDAATKRCREK
ncbi:hypothetical protein [Cupriavidus sp.]|uniref:hypothetical protein n=1 Tax=Cupriavidus sp. TaxID=1873897 RepID=UPI0025BEFF60|nr:hypothetical protein [Cupriavidus sp.]MCA3183935.1 hypothetical protein [Cupriavidus sp.]MCA3193577.1 hypothetical protein [Cupriavidus sp.]MCA3199967.1 hypothetical protein [Cupriavidus sp.]MCA3201980.1 hypothetical protein [Cupriavidus sp.]MCA3233932.1 hypothetical protein [Cupriavidus sp.]